MLLKMEYPNIPGLNGFRFWKFLSLTDAGVSSKLNHSNSWLKNGVNPAFCAWSITFFNTFRGQTAALFLGESINSQRKNGTLFSQGIFLNEDKSIRAGASG